MIISANDLNIETTTLSINIQVKNFPSIDGQNQTT